MNKIRVIIQSSPDGNLFREEVIFTEYLDTPIDDFKVPGLTIDSDIIIDNNLPSGFPTETTLRK